MNNSNDGVPVDAVVTNVTDTPEADAKGVEAAEVTQVRSAKEIAEETGEKGNLILGMTDIQKQAYLSEVSDVKDRVLQAGRAYVVAHWHVGRVAQKLRDDQAKNSGSTYGKATVEGFAHDVGMGKSTIYRCIRVQETFTLKQLQKVPLTTDGVDLLLSAAPSVQKAVMDNLAERADGSTDYRPSTNDVRAMVDQEVEKHAEAAGGVTDSKGQAAKKANSFGNNSATGTSHKQVLSRFIKQVENLQGAGTNALISLKEIPKDTDITDKGELTLLKMQEDTLAEIEVALETLGALQEAFKAAAAQRVDKEAEMDRMETEAQKAKEAQKAEKAAAAEKKRAEAAAKKPAAKKPAAKKPAAKKPAQRRSSGKSKLPGSSQRGPAGGKT